MSEAEPAQIALDSLYSGQSIVIRDNVLVNQPEITVGGSARGPINLTLSNNQHIDS